MTTAGEGGIIRKKKIVIAAQGGRALEVLAAIAGSQDTFKYQRHFTGTSDRYVGEVKDLTRPEAPPLQVELLVQDSPTADIRIIEVQGQRWYPYPPKNGTGKFDVYVGSTLNAKGIKDAANQTVAWIAKEVSWAGRQVKYRRGRVALAQPDSVAMPPSAGSGRWRTERRSRLSFAHF